MTRARPPSGTSSHGDGVVIRRGLDSVGKRSHLGAGRKTVVVVSFGSRRTGTKCRNDLARRIIERTAVNKLVLCFPSPLCKVFFFNAGFRL